MRAIANVALSLVPVWLKLKDLEKAKTGSRSPMARKASSFAFRAVPLFAKACLTVAESPDSYWTPCSRSQPLSLGWSPSMHTGGPVK